MNKTGTAYILWAGCVLGLNGLHRLYNGKIGTGLLWLCTGGLLGIGQFIDLLLIPSMVEDHNLKIRAKLGVSSSGVPLAPTSAVTMTVPERTRQDLMISLVKAAYHKGGRLSVTQGVMATGSGFMEVEATLNEMVKTGYVSITNDNETGIVIYQFHELS